MTPRAAGGGPSLHLVWVDAAGGRHVKPLSDGQRIGSSAELADIVLAGPGVNPLHAEVRAGGGVAGLVLKAMGTSTFEVDGRVVASAALVSGSVLRIGLVTARVTDTPHAAPARVAPPPAQVARSRAPEAAALAAVLAVLVVIVVRSLSGREKPPEARADAAAPTPPAASRFERDTAGTEPSPTPTPSERAKNVATWEKQVKQEDEKAGIENAVREAVSAGTDRAMADARTRLPPGDDFVGCGSPAITMGYSREGATSISFTARLSCEVVHVGSPNTFTTLYLEGRVVKVGGLWQPDVVSSR